MAYRVLYRKWRPQTFKDVVGQPQVTVTLEGEVSLNRLSHAYLFTGSRGTGKTSCAKILAKAVNCLDPQSGNPCNKCENCLGIDSGAILDVVEIDAASNRGIDDIRALREESVFTPAQAKYRVYIIDEVHMLTIEAFNALLKTLEEPPKHVIFILATTEVHKLPSTILSRCQRFDFHRIEPEQIAKRLEFVAEQEGASLDYEAAILIARIADGALRDALSLLDRCLAADQKNIDSSLVREAVGIISRDSLFALSAAIHERDSAKALLIADELHKSAFDSERLCSELVHHYRDLMLVKTLDGPEDMIVSTKEEMEFLKKHAAAFTLEEILRATQVLSSSAEALRRSKNGRIEIESALIRLCSPSLDEDISALLARIAVLEKAVLEGGSIEKTIPVFECDAPLKKAGAKQAQKKQESEEMKAQSLPFTPDIPKTVQEANGFEEETLPFTPDFTQTEQKEQKGGGDEVLPFSPDISQTEQQEHESGDEEFLPFGPDTAHNSVSSYDEDEILPFDEEDDFEAPAIPETPTPSVPPFLANQMEEGGETGLLQGRIWDELCAEIVRQSPPMVSMVKGASGEVRGDFFVFKTPNPLVNSIFENSEEYCAALSAAIKTVLNKDLNIKVELIV